MLNTPFSPWPSFTSEEGEAVQRVLLSNKVNYWTGTEAREFEKEFSSWCQTEYAIALSNGTLALELALRALGVGPGDEVVVTPRTFIASISCVVNVGAVPVFADVDINTGNINADSIEAVLTSKTKAVICVHLAGWPCDMDPIMALAKKHNLKIIEDCAQAHGAKYKGRSVGSIGDVGAWSFCQDKIMTTGGEGGMVTTNDEQLWRYMWSFKDHGKSYEAVYERRHPPGFRWLHEDFGTNWRMLEIQAVLGRMQLRKMPSWTEQRQNNALKLSQAIRPFAQAKGPVRLPDYACNGCPKTPSLVKNETCLKGCTHGQYKYYFYVQPDNLAPDWTRDRIIKTINDLNVPCFQGSCSEVYLEKAFDGTGCRPKERLPVAKELGENSLMFLIHPTLTSAEIDKTCQAISVVLSDAGANT